MTQFEELLKALLNEGVEFVVIGGLAANIHGVTVPTYDIDICYNRSPENLKRLARALHPLNPTVRAPKDPPFRADEATLKAGLNFTLETRLGDINILGEVGRIGFYKEAEHASSEVSMFGLKVRVMSINALIKSKKFAGRKKDEEMILQLEAMKEMREKKEINFIEHPFSYRIHYQAYETL